MSELTSAKQQYFQLMRLVTKGHELYFVADSNKVFAVIGVNQRVLLCEKDELRWRSANVTQLIELERFLAGFMNQNKIIEDKLTEKIRLTLFGHSS